MASILSQALESMEGILILKSAINNCTCISTSQKIFLRTCLMSYAPLEQDETNSGVTLVLFPSIK